MKKFRIFRKGNSTQMTNILGPKNPLCKKKKNLQKFYFPETLKKKKKNTSNFLNFCIVVMSEVAKYWCLGVGSCKHTLAWRKLVKKYKLTKILLIFLQGKSSIQLIVCLLLKICVMKKKFFFPGWLLIVFDTRRERDEISN